MSDGCSASSTYRAAPPHSRAMRACWSTSEATGCPRRVSSTCFRTRRTWSRWPSSIDATRFRLTQNKTGRDQLAPCWTCRSPVSVALACEREQQLQQADEDVVDVEEQVERRGDVVRFATAD